MEFTHKHLIGPKEQIPAMNRVKKILKEGNFSGTVFPFSKGMLRLLAFKLVEAKATSTIPILVLQNNYNVFLSLIWKKIITITYLPIDSNDL